MRVCDYIAQQLVNHGIKNVYGLMGGGASGLNDGFIKNPDINYVCFHHEQAAGYAAIGEAKYTRNFAVVNPTTGCGGTNCITPLLDAWQDGVPVLFISGNVKLSQTSRFINKFSRVSIRKYGIQENDIIKLVGPLTKDSIFIENYKDIPYVLDIAFDLMTTGRPGPVWIDIPSDIQVEKMDEETLSYKFRFRSIDDLYSHEFSDRKIIENLVYRLIKHAKRPIVLAGNGIAQANAIDEFITFINKYKIPYVSTYGARDFIPYDDPYNIGCIGVKGSRAGNMAMQRADVLLILGCSLNSSHIGYSSELFSPNSYKIMVDIHRAELDKEIVFIDEKYNMHLSKFFTVVNGV